MNLLFLLSFNRSVLRSRLHTIGKYLNHSRNKYTDHFLPNNRKFPAEPLKDELLHPAGRISTTHSGTDATFEMAVTLHTDLGEIKIELFCERTPKTCENFLALCASGFYNGCIFHRNIKGFMVQTGDPTGTGKGGTSIWGRKFEDEYSEHLKHNVRGVVSMANNGPNTNGSQFFFTYAKQPHLDMKYTAFGKIIDGLETLDELEKLPVNEKTFRPLTETRIKDVTIHANPFAG